MSHAATIIGIPGLQIERVKRSLGIGGKLAIISASFLWARPYRSPPCKHCLSPDLGIKATHQRTVKHTRQGNQVLTLHLQVPKYHCQACRRYFRHPFLDAAATASLRMASRISHAPDLRKTTGLSGILGRVGGSGSPGKNPEAAAATSLRRGDAETSSTASGRRSVPRPVLSAQASM